MIRSKTAEGGARSKRVDKVKFTGAGYPIHDYLSEMRAEKQKKKPKDKNEEQALNSAMILSSKYQD